MKKRYICTGFTLAELLAVVIILAILTSLSLGYYKRSVEQSRFGEGLSAASAVVEAVNQAYLDQQLSGETPTARPKVKTLDIDFASATADDTKPYSFILPHFEVRVETNGNVRAYRGDATSYTYYVNVQPSFASANKDQISCVGANADGKTFCESMGYTTCTPNTYSCTK